MSVSNKSAWGLNKRHTCRQTRKLFTINFLVFMCISQGLWAADEPVKLDKIEVTGSHIKRVDTEGPSPVAIIDNEDIAKSGAASLSELLKGLTVTNGGSFDEKYVNSFSPGTSSVNLRGMGPNSTLVLVNGRRIANHSFASELTQSFVDLNSIPLAAVDRIEIVKDGASAIYGSDALAGVVNIILKKDYEGSTVSLKGGKSGHNDANETGVSMATGVSSNTGNITFVVDYSKRSEVGLKDRKFSASADHTSQKDGIDFRSPTYPTANVLDGSGNLAYEAGGVIPAFYGYYDFNKDISMIPETERTGVLISMDRDIEPDLTFFSQILANRTRTLAHLSPSDVWGLDDNVVVPAGQTYNTFVDSGNNPIDVYPYWRMTELGRRSLDTVTDSNRVIAGLKGVVADWDWEGAVNYSKSSSFVTGKNYVDRVALIDAINNNTINPFGTSPNSPDALNSIRATISRKGESVNAGVDLKAQNEIAELDSGPVMLAVGGEHFHESMKDTPDAAMEAGRILGQGATSVDGSRDRSAIYTEADVPVRDDVEMQLALRTENYSDFGNTTNPKIAVRYQPSSSAMLRASYGTGFRAPSLAEMYIGNSVDRPFLIDGSSAPAQYPVVYSGNPDLKPEKSTSLYLGGVFEPVQDLDLSIDYWQFHTKDVIDNNAQFLIDNESSYPGQVIRPGGPGTPIAVIYADFVNIAEQKTNGIDMEAGYKWKLDTGNLNFKETLTKLLSFKRRATADRPFEELAGTYRYPVLRSKTTLGWSMSSFTTSLTANFIDGYKDKYYGRYNSYTGAIDNHRVDSQLTYDFQFVYNFEKISSITLGVLNITDVKPPFTNAEIEGYDYATHNPIGRYFYGKYSADF